jgi:hypothetical protein
MKNQNMRDLEKQWANKKKESLKPGKAGAKASGAKGGGVRTINRGGQRGS